MSLLQTIGTIWLVITAFVIFAIGSAFGGAKAGFELLVSAVCVIAFYSAAAALLYYTAVAIATTLVA